MGACFSSGKQELVPGERAGDSIGILQGGQASQRAAPATKLEPKKQTSTETEKPMLLEPAAHDQPGEQESLPRSRVSVKESCPILLATGVLLALGTLQDPEFQPGPGLDMFGTSEACMVRGACAMQACTLPPCACLLEGLLQGLPHRGP